MGTEVQKEKKVTPVQCKVTSDRMDKSRVATMESIIKHERYGKYQRRRTKLMFHDEANLSKLGDMVLITPSRPYSARKRFVLLEVVKKA